MKTESLSIDVLQVTDDQSALQHNWRILCISTHDQRTQSATSTLNTMVSS